LLQTYRAGLQRPEEVAVSHKKDELPTSSLSSASGPSDTAAPAQVLTDALKGFMATLHQQAARNTDVIDVFGRALRDLDREMKDERVRREILERRLRESEARVEALARVVAALARQGWVN
jgi:hypothetical protein